MAQSKDTPKRAVGYSRTSGEGQRDNTSIPEQQDQIGAYCEREGYELVRHYADECKTGKQIAGRDGFQSLMKDAAAGKCDVVVVYSIDRFGRDRGDPEKHRDLNGVDVQIARLSRGKGDGHFARGALPVDPRLDMNYASETGVDTELIADGRGVGDAGQVARQKRVVEARLRRQVEPGLGGTGQTDQKQRNGKQSSHESVPSEDGGTIPLPDRGSVGDGRRCS